jgi:hypothetical protein
MLELHLTFRCSEYLATTTTIKVQASAAATLFLFGARLLFALMHAR